VTKETPPRPPRKSFKGGVCALAHCRSLRLTFPPRNSPLGAASRRGNKVIATLFSPSQTPHSSPCAPAHTTPERTHHPPRVGERVSPTKRPRVQGFQRDGGCDRPLGTTFRPASEARGPGGKPGVFVGGVGGRYCDETISPSDKHPSIAHTPRPCTDVTSHQPYPSSAHHGRSQEQIPCISPEILL